MIEADYILRSDRKLPGTSEHPDLYQMQHLSSTQAYREGGLGGWLPSTHNDSGELFVEPGSFIGQNVGMFGNARIINGTTVLTAANEESRTSNPSLISGNVLIDKTQMLVRKQQRLQVKAGEQFVISNSYCVFVEDSIFENVNGHITGSRIEAAVSVTSCELDINTSTMGMLIADDAHLSFTATELDISVFHGGVHILNSSSYRPLRDIERFLTFEGRNYHTNYNDLSLEAYYKNTNLCGVKAYETEFRHIENVTLSGTDIKPEQTILVGNDSNCGTL